MTNSLAKVFCFFPAILLITVFNQVYAADKVYQSYGHSLFGELKYKKNFKHFDYVNPKAPKKGTLRLMAVGSYDSFNPFISKGTPADGSGLMYDTLMTESLDEPNSSYGLIAQSLEYPSDKSWVIFTLRPRAKFQDDTPIKAEDVVFSFNTLMQYGSPVYKQYYADVKSVKTLPGNKVRFNFKHNNNRELMHILGQVPIFPKHYWANQLDQFAKSSLTVPLGSGPYTINRFKPGRSVTYKRVKNYWAKDLPVRKGFYNFNKIHYDYYRDSSVALEAFKSKNYDFRSEYTAKNWAKEYQGPALESGQITKELVPNQSPQGMQGFVFNLRNPLFKDRKVRQALSLLFDFEWTNKNLFYSSYQRTQSYFSNSDLGANGLPSEAELKLLSPFKNSLPKEVFSQVYQAPKSNGSGNIRSQIRQAYQLLAEAGWHLQSNRLVNQKGQTFRFTLILFQTAFERVVLPFKNNLKKLGIDMDIRFVDISQYIRRLNSFDYDMVVMSYPQTNAPGNEQLLYWSTKAAKTPSSRNYAGIENPAVDALIKSIIEAKTYEQLQTATRALDRVLLWNYYMIPQWYRTTWNIAYWHDLEHPDFKKPMYQLTTDTWWKK